VSDVERITAVVLAGGMGRRMGAPKAGVILNGRPLLSHVLDVVVPFADETIVVRSEQAPLPQIEHEDVTVLVDTAPQEGPLRAVATALARIDGGLALLVGCDMPFLNPTLLRHLTDLAGAHEAVVPVVDGKAQPLHAMYRPAVAAQRAAEVLASGDRRLTTILGRLSVRWIERSEWWASDPTGTSFSNINTLEDLRQASDLT
jgi:molybdenum cofactor guanylyltransferase